MRGGGGTVRICLSIQQIDTQPVIFRIELGGKPKWLPLSFGYNDVMLTDALCHAFIIIATDLWLVRKSRTLLVPSGALSTADENPRVWLIFVSGQLITARLMFARLWSMPALSGMAPYVKRMPFVFRGFRLQSPVASFKLRDTPPKANCLKLLTGHRSAGGVKLQVFVCFIAFLSSKKIHWQSACHLLPSLAIHDHRVQRNWFFQLSEPRNTPPLSSSAHQWCGTLSPHTYRTYQMIDNSKIYSPNTFPRMIYLK